jgi:hypothetical protein
MRLGAETVEQIKLFDWIRTRPDIYPYAWHCPNERRVSPQHGRILKRMGVKSGVSDVFIAIPTASHHGLFLELKTDKGKLSVKQSEFLYSMNLQGYQALAVWGFEAAQAAILAYLGEPQEQLRSAFS